MVTSKATIRMTVRGSTVDDLEGIILPAIKEAAQGIAASYGARVEMHHYEPLFRICVKIKLLALFNDVMTEFGETPRILPDDRADGSTDVEMYLMKYQQHNLTDWVGFRGSYTRVHLCSRFRLWIGASD